MNNIYYNDYFSSYDSYPLSNVDSCYNVVDNFNYECNYRNNIVQNNDGFFSPSEGFAKGNMQANIYEPYKLVNPSLPKVNNDRQRLLLEVQKYGFAMWDLNLYLNTHPADRNAMKIFENYRTMYKKVCNDYENKYGSLHVSMTDANSGYWPWNKSPWPWEVE